jgi:peptide/nickel transport system substrate-binding protein
MDSVTVTYWASLDTTAPELESRRYVSTGVTSVGFRNDIAPFNNIEVRKALMIGTDIRAFRALIKSGKIQLPLNPWPFYAEDPYYYTPLEELPPEIQSLYSYNPTLARQMLTAQGIPTGFKIVLEMTPGDQTVVALLKDQWTKIGIDLQIVLEEYAVLWAKTGTANKTYTQAIFAGWESGDPVSMLSAWVRTGARQNDCVYKNPTVDALIDEMNASRDRAEQKSLAKEALTIMRDDVPMIPLQSGTQAHFWWPWLKNYYGEVNVADWCNTMPIMACTWIDQDMKADMGFK